MSENLYVSCIQSDLTWENKNQNFNNFEKKIHQLPKETQLVILPEMFTTGFSMEPEKFAESINGESTIWLQKQASISNKIIIGSIIISENAKFYNRLVTAFPDGTLLSYDKRHLFRMAGEHKRYSGGTKKLFFNINKWSVSPLICYDLRFPVWSRNKNNYNLLIYIANWPERRTYLWKHLLIARAIENQAYVIGVNRVGKDGNGINHSGDSMIIDPYGQIVVQAKPNMEEILNAELIYNEIEKVREKFPVFLDADEFEIK